MGNALAGLDGGFGLGQPPLPLGRVERFEVLRRNLLKGARFSHGLTIAPMSESFIHQLGKRLLERQEAVHG
jgi:hypothetical protein